MLDLEVKLEDQLAEQIIGLILLMGIVKKNSILLVEFTNHVREQGRDVKTALIEACPVRLRPILMTSIATVVGAIPPALALGPGAESMIPMALSVIGGVLVSTTLTLFVVPSVYLMLSRFETKKTVEELQELAREQAELGFAVFASGSESLAHAVARKPED